MEFLLKLEQVLHKWLKGAPHLPTSAHRWLGENIWWVTAVFAVAAGVGVLGLTLSFFRDLVAIGSPFASYYASETFVMWSAIQNAVKLAFTAVVCLLLALAIAPLRLRQQKGWVLAFAALLVSALGVVVSAVLTLSTLNFITNIIFGALWLGVWAYFIFEMRSQFVHVEQSKGVKAEKHGKKSKS